GAEQRLSLPRLFTAPLSSRTLGAVGELCRPEPVGMVAGRWWDGTEVERHSEPAAPWPRESRGDLLHVFLLRHEHPRQRGWAGSGGVQDRVLGACASSAVPGSAVGTVRRSGFTSE